MCWSDRPAPEPAGQACGAVYHAPAGAVPFADYLEASNRLARENDIQRGRDVVEWNPQAKSRHGSGEPPRRADVARIGDLPPLSAHPKKQPVETVSHARMQGSGTIIDVVV